MNRERGPVFLGALRAAALRPQVWSASWALVALLALAGTMPWLGFFKRTLSTEEPGSQMGWLTETFRFDQSEGLGALASASAASGAILAFLAMLVGCFCAGGWLQVFLQRASGHSLRRFFFGGARFFWRFVRVLLLTLVVLGVGSWVIYGVPWDFVVEEFLLDIADREELTSERSAKLLEWFQHGFFAAWMALVMVWGDYVRARLAMHEAKSAVWAGIATLGTLMANPLRTLRPPLLLFACEWALVWPIGRWVQSLNTGMNANSGVGTILLLAMLVQLALAWRAVVRGAHLYAAVRIGRQVIEPPAKPDPWSNRVGGPGGPQYPIGGDDDDDYGVSI